MLSISIEKNMEKVKKKTSEYVGSFFPYFILNAH